MPATSLLSYGAHCALVWTPAAVCTAIVGLRIWLRARLSILGAEDQLMVVAWVFQIIAAGLTQGNIDAVDNTVYDDVRISTQNIYTSFSCVISIVCGKISVALLLLRLMGHASRWRKWSVIGSVVVLVMLSVAFLPADTLDVCRYDGADTLVTGCMDPSVSEGLVQTWNFYSAALDIFYSILPITFLYRLHMSATKKAVVTWLLSLGWSAAVFTILRAVAGYAWGEDSDTAAYIHLLANYMEPALVIICGSLATFMPLSDRWRLRKSSRARATDPYKPPHIFEKKGSNAASTVSEDVRVRSESGGPASRDQLLPQTWVDRRYEVDVSSEERHV